ncbi:hypothetical protein F5050DRAFT_28280 [Lentinula boryana]|uniref:Mid2 domain-containing protein n=1 Tax=Lentinula boryana TaxID=40481 RepID=A0ABQ8QVY6_9AGAR|nr:hypothetical protein F5050DRAFT_28280 [Lentinula boryana]
MFKKVTLTLLVYLVAVFAISSFVEAKSFDTINHRDHGNLKRLIKKRATTPVEGVGSEPSVTESAAAASTTSASSSSVSSTSAKSTAASTSASSTASSAASSSVSSSSVSSSASSSSSSASSSSSTSSTSSSSSSTSSSSSSTTPTSTATSTPSTSQATQTHPSADDTEPITSVISGTLVTLTESVAASSTASSSASVSGATSSSVKTAGITVVIVIASCVGGIAILWTIFRKWKLGRSSKFDQRLQPINWQPTTEDSGIPTHRRRASDSSSFHSGVHGGASDMGHRSSENGHSTYGAADLPPLPSHDFTAGPSHLTPVGGYADLARGPSPQPQMQETLTRGPSITRNYDPNVPLHHQTGYGATDGY